MCNLKFSHCHCVNASLMSRTPPHHIMLGNCEVWRHGKMKGVGPRGEVSRVSWSCRSFVPTSPITFSWTMPRAQQVRARTGARSRAPRSGARGPVGAVAGNQRSGTRFSKPRSGVARALGPGRDQPYGTSCAPSTSHPAQIFLAESLGMRNKVSLDKVIEYVGMGGGRKKEGGGRETQRDRKKGEE